MAPKKPKAATEPSILDYRHEDAKRKNIPPAGLAAKSFILLRRYQYGNPKTFYYRRSMETPRR